MEIKKSRTKFWRGFDSNKFDYAFLAFAAGFLALTVSFLRLRYALRRDRF